MSVVGDLINFMGIKKDAEDFEDKFIVEDDDYEDNVFDDDSYDPEPVIEKEFEPQPKSPRRYITNKPTSTKVRRTNMNLSGGLEVCVLKPVSIEDAKGITQTLLQNRAVVLNLEGLDVDVAQRIIDFTSGSCYAIDGNLQKISNYIFIVTPQSVGIAGDFPADIFGGGNSEVSTI